MLPLPTARRAAFAATAVVTAAVAGCRAAVDRAFQRPTVTFSDAALHGGVGPSGATIDVFAVVHNPNPYPLHAARVRYRLLTGDSLEIGHGEATDSLSVAAHDSATLVLPVTVPFAGLLRAGVGLVAGAAATGGADYRVLGDVVLAHTPVGDLSVPIDVRGRATLVPH